MSASSSEAPFGSVTVVVPTFREAENLPVLLQRLRKVRDAHQLELEVLIMDDDSCDGSVAAVHEFGADWVEIIVRTKDRGLSPAVTEGLLRARKDVVVVMDADLSHPPEKVPEMLAALAAGADFVIGSRYVTGGSTDDDWGLFRWLNSRIATLLAKPLTSADDPMSGFFAVRKKSLEGVAFNAVGYKIGLEVIVKCNLAHVVEVPIHFTDRVHGESKLTFKQQLLYIRHLRRLYIHKFASISELMQFAAVGASGVVVNLAALSALVHLGVEEHVAVASAIAVSMVTNFFLNRRFTFGYARDGNIWRQFIGFVGACLFGAAVNYGVTLGVRAMVPTLHLSLAALCGVAAGLGFNFAINRFLVFKKRFYRPREDHRSSTDPAAGLPDEAARIAPSGPSDKP